MAALNRLKSLYRKTVFPEKLFGVLLLLYLCLLWIAPASGFLLLTQIALTVTGFIVAARWASRGVRSAIWRLRNRLVVAYLFIAVVPVVLIVLLVGIGAYLLTGQISVYLVTSELEERIEGLTAPARELLVTPPSSRPAQMAWLAQTLNARYPNLQVLIRERTEWRFPEGSSIAPPPAPLPDGSGLILRGNQTFLWAHASDARADAFLLVPLSARFLDGLIPNLGDVSVVNGPDTVSRRVTFSSRAGSNSRVPAAANWLDIPVLWFTLTQAANWESPSEARELAVGVTSRPFAVVRTLFGGRVDPSQGNLGLAFIIVAVLFLVVELVALVIGVSMTRAITSAVHGLYEGTRRVTSGDFTHRIEVKGNDQLAELSRSFNDMTANIERLLSVEKEKERLQSELEIASEVQSQLYPKTVPAVEGLELLAHCNPARTVSGDYYDYLHLNGSRLALAIGDVAGKGISAALLMATVQSSLRTQIRACLEAAASGQGPAASGLTAAHLVSQLNQQLYLFTSAEKFATFYFGIYDFRTGLLRYTNAGHPPPIVVRNGRVLRLETNGMVVGAFPFSEFSESSIELEPGDLLACFTDGITEPENEYGEMFGEDRLIEVLQRNSSATPAEIIDEVYTAVRQWTISAEAQDDMTMLVARRL